MRGQAAGPEPMKAPEPVGEAEHYLCGTIVVDAIFISGLLDLLGNALDEIFYFLKDYIANISCASVGIWMAVCFINFGSVMSPPASRWFTTPSLPFPRSHLHSQWEPRQERLTQPPPLQAYLSAVSSHPPSLERLELINLQFLNRLIFEAFFGSYCRLKYQLRHSLVDAIHISNTWFRLAFNSKTLPNPYFFLSLTLASASLLPPVLLALPNNQDLVRILRNQAGN